MIRSQVMELLLRNRASVN